MADTRRTPKRVPHATTYGAPLPPAYANDDAYREAVERLGVPGEPPYTRGVQPTMYRGRLWTMRQYAGFGTAEETNARFRYLLEHGQTGLSVAFDLPTQMGYDADDPQVAAHLPPRASHERDRLHGARDRFDLLGLRALLDAEQNDISDHQRARNTSFPSIFPMRSRASAIGLYSPFAHS